MITALYAGVSGLALIALSINVIRNRMKFATTLGDGADLPLTRAIRAQGNFIEYTVFFLLLLLLSEQSAAPGFVLHIFGCVFLFGRGLHAYSLLKAEQYENGKITALPVWRIRGMMCSFTAIGGLSLLLIGDCIYRTMAS